MTSSAVSRQGSSILPEVENLYPVLPCPPAGPGARQRFCSIGSHPCPAASLSSLLLHLSLLQTPGGEQIPKPSGYVHLFTPDYGRHYILHMAWSQRILCWSFVPDVVALKQWTFQRNHLKGIMRSPGIWHWEGFLCFLKNCSYLSQAQIGIIFKKQ